MARRSSEADGEHWPVPLSRIKPCILALASPSSPSPALMQKYTCKQAQHAVEADCKNLVQDHRNLLFAKKGIACLRGSEAVHERFAHAISRFQEGKEEDAGRGQYGTVPDAEEHRHRGGLLLIACCLQAARTGRSAAAHSRAAQTPDRSQPTRPAATPEIRQQPGSRLESLPFVCARSRRQYTD